MDLLALQFDLLLATPELIMAGGALALLLLGVLLGDRSASVVNSGAVLVLAAAGAAAVLVAPPMGETETRASAGQTTFAYSFVTTRSHALDVARGGERIALDVDYEVFASPEGRGGTVRLVEPARDGEAIVIARAGGGVAFHGALALDSLARFAKVLIALAAIAALVMSRGFLKNERLSHFEYPVLVVLASLGMMMMVSAQDLMALYLGVEIQSLALYVLAAFNRDSLRASEAGLKYFVLGALSSGLLLYGMSLVYGFSGAIGFDAIAAHVAEGAGPGVVVGLVFIMCGLAFKVSAAPFHMWTPDVYEGAPTPVTAFFAAAPKLASMVLFARVLQEPFGAATDDWRMVLAIIAALSLAIGSFGALAQSNIKRLMAYSSIANMGFALTPLCAGTQDGVEGMLLFMTIYLISVTGVFACILMMRRREGMVERVDDLAGLSTTHPGVAVALTVLVFSIAGVPPLAGFFGKWYAFLPAWEAGLRWLVFVGIAASAVSAVYYLKLVRVMWFESAPSALNPAPRALAAISAGAAILMFPLLILPLIAAPGREAIAHAASALFF